VSSPLDSDHLFCLWVISSDTVNLRFHNESGDQIYNSYEEDHLDQQDVYPYQPPLYAGTD